MSSLLKLPNNDKFTIQKITPLDANWKYVGFEVYDLHKGQKLKDKSNQREFCIVLLSGTANFATSKNDFGIMKGRSNVFEKIPPIAMYVPKDEAWEILAKENCEIAVCTAPSVKGKYNSRMINHANMSQEVRGEGSNKRFICNILPENKDAESLLVVEVITPSGNWSSYPPHKHDKDNLPFESQLEETYYHRINPSQGYVMQRVYNESKTLDENISATDRSVVLVPEGYHPVGVPHGYESYYLNVMAGPKRIWKFHNDPDHEWIINQ